MFQEKYKMSFVFNAYTSNIKILLLLLVSKISGGPFFCVRFASLFVNFFREIRNIQEKMSLKLVSFW